MFEVELKAHVANRADVIKKLNSFARFDRIIIKDDIYFKLERPGKERVTARIRTEEHRATEDFFNFTEQKIIEKKTFLNYKKKERRTESDGSTIEVNDEYETEISDAECVKELLLASGFENHFCKHKDSFGWHAECQGEFFSSAHLELCAVPPLGDFLEIEILSPRQDEEALREINSTLKSLVVKSGLEIRDIEEKYYSELLEQLELTGDSRQQF